MMKFIMFFLTMNMMTNMYKKKLFLILMLNMLFMLIFFFFFNYLFLNYYWNNLNYMFAMDKLSFILIMLTLWILSLSMFASMTPFNNKYKIMFFNTLILMMNILFISFCSMNMMIFYFFFETSLIPMLLIIMGWGMQINKIQASMYMIFYTLLGSLPLLVTIMFIYYNNKTLMFNMLILKNNNNYNMYLYIMMNSAFLIKLPMFLTHLWLPKAHVEAPISGSMILAGIMLKLGSYGIYRSSLIFPLMYTKYNLFMMIITLTGSIITSIICLNQTDMKTIVAYSSIVHMNFMLSSMLTLYFMSFKGAIIIMIAHGLTSPGMFFLVNLNYEKIHSRSIFLNKGFLCVYPSITLWWFLIFSSNFAAPPSLNLFGEIMLINCISQWNDMLMNMILLISFFSTCYSIFMFAYTQFSKFNLMMFNNYNMNCREFLILILHWLPLNILFLNLYFM